MFVLSLVGSTFCFWWLDFRVFGDMFGQWGHIRYFVHKEQNLTEYEQWAFVGFLPLTSIIMWVISSITSIDIIESSRYFNLLIVPLTMFPVFKITDFFYGKSAAIWATMASTLNGSILFVGSLPGTQYFYLVTVYVLYLVLFYALNGGVIRGAILVGLNFGAYFARPEMLAYTAFCAVFLVVISIGKRETAFRNLPMSICLFIFILLNPSILDNWILSATNFEIGNAKFALEQLTFAIPIADKWGLDPTTYQFKMFKEVVLYSASWKQELAGFGIDNIKRGFYELARAAIFLSSELGVLGIITVGLLFRLTIGRPENKIQLYGDMFLLCSILYLVVSILTFQTSNRHSITALLVLAMIAASGISNAKIKPKVGWVSFLVAVSIAFLIGFLTIGVDNSRKTIIIFSFFSVVILIIFFFLSFGGRVLATKNAATHNRTYFFLNFLLIVGLSCNLFSPMIKNLYDLDKSAVDPIHKEIGLFIKNKYGSVPTVGVFASVYADAPALYIPNAPLDDALIHWCNQGGKLLVMEENWFGRNQYWHPNPDKGFQQLSKGEKQVRLFKKVKTFQAKKEKVFVYEFSCP